MEDFKKILNYNDDEEMQIIKAPYYLVIYIDYEGRTHMAQITDLCYLQYIKDTFIIKECEYIEI